MAILYSRWLVSKDTIISPYGLQKIRHQTDSAKNMDTFDGATLDGKCNFVGQRLVDDGGSDYNSIGAAVANKLVMVLW